MAKELVIGYGDKKIPINYYPLIGIGEELRKNCVFIRIKGAGEDKNEEYKKAEEIALANLIHNAAKKERDRLYLVEIDKVKQTIIGQVINNHLEIEIILEGVAVFGKS